MARTGLRIYAGYKLAQRRARGKDHGESSRLWAEAHDDAARRLFALATSLKGLYVKSGQFIGTRSDIFPSAYVEHLSKLQDRVPPRPLSVIERVIAEEFGLPLKQLFADFDPTPVAAASLAQVHRATLAGGQEVAVKVQYPEVADLVRLDLRNMRTAVGLVARREPNFDYRAIVDELGRQIPLELDFVREGRMTSAVAHNLEAVPGIVVPHVIEGMVARRVLVTEYLHGRRLLDPSGLPPGFDGPEVARRLAGAYGHQIMVDGLFQADPHPGNVLLLADGRIALLDFGLTKELPPEVQAGFARLVVASAARDIEGVLAAFRQLGVRTKSEGAEDVLALVGLFFDSREITSGGTDYRKRTVSTLTRNPVEAIPGDLVLLGRVVGLLRGVSSSLGSPLSPMQMLRPYAEALLAREGGRA